MANREAGSRTPARVAMAGLLLGALLNFGCGPGSGGKEGGSKRLAIAPETPAPEKPAAPVQKKDSRLQQSFAEATISGDDAPEGQYLPDRTTTGKSVGRLYERVKDLWDKCPLVSPAGKRLEYRAILETDLGAIPIDFRPDVAPNHVRNFVALARAKYFDGLRFERKHHEAAEDDPQNLLEYLEAGSPIGAEDEKYENYGSIGYWMKPEFSKQIVHEEGTVGAWHAREADTAACKFYITLTRAPVMDGNFTAFGKVSGGLDVLRAIARKPLRTDDEYKDRLEAPVAIKKVTVEVRELDK